MPELKRLVAIKKISSLSTRCVRWQNRERWNLYDSVHTGEVF
ncbi:hypothetical protein [Parahaliea mediterranea]|nr:hypothetical protein [Parahaliea mediterranea]